MNRHSGGVAGTLWLGLATLAALAIAVPTVAADEGPTRAEYTERVERICEPSWKANPRHVTVAERIIRREQLHKYPIASRRMMVVYRNTVRDVKRISRVTPPAADATTIRRWVRFLRQGRDLQKGIALALRADQKGRVDRLSTRLSNIGGEGNNFMVRRGFSLEYCRFEDSRS